MRGYIARIEPKDDPKTGERKHIYMFCSSIKEAAHWSYRELAEIELPLMNGVGGRITMDDTGLVCSDFQIEERHRNQFVISCECPTNQHFSK